MCMFLYPLQVGAQTETELKEKKLRVEDALNATKAAVEEGIVIGGGCTLLKLAAKVDAVKETLSNEEQKVREGRGERGEEGGACEGALCSCNVVGDVLVNSRRCAVQAQAHAPLPLLLP